MVGIALLLTARMSGLDVNGTGKVDEVKALLRSFGVPGPYRLQMLSIPEDQRFNSTTVVLTDRNSVEYKASFPYAEYKTFILRRTKENFFIGFPSREFHNPKLEALAEARVAFFYGKEHVRFDDMLTGDKNLAEAHFSVIRNGFPFIGGASQFGYTVTMSVPDGKFVSFVAKVNPPPVDPSPAKLTLQDAVDAFKVAFKAEIAPHALTKNKTKVTYDTVDKGTLGYFLPEGESVARLVWSIPYRAMRVWPDGAMVGNAVATIDAVSGKLIPGYNDR